MAEYKTHMIAPDGETELRVTFDFVQGRPATWEQPAESDEIDITSACQLDGTVFDLDDETKTELENELYNNLSDHLPAPPDFEYDPLDFDWEPESMYPYDEEAHPPVGADLN